MSARFRKFAVYSFPVLLGFAVHLFLIVPAQKRGMERGARDRLTAATYLKTERVSSWLSERGGDISTAISEPAVRNWARDQKGAARFLKGILPLYGYEGAYIATLDGKVQLEVHRDGARPDTSAFLERIQSQYLIDPKRQFFLDSTKIGDQSRDSIAIIRPMPAIPGVHQKNIPTLILYANVNEALGSMFADWPFPEAAPSTCIAQEPNAVSKICSKMADGQSHDTEAGLAVERLIPLTGWFLSTHTPYAQVYLDLQARALARSIPWLLVALFGIFWWLGERKRANLLVKQTERQYQKLVESVDQMHVRTSLDGTPLEVNAAAVKILGYRDAADLIATSRTVGIIADPAERDKIIRVLEHEDFMRVPRLEMRRKDGSIAVTQVGIRLIRDSFGVPVGLEGFGSDITEREMYERAMLKERNIVRMYLDTVGVAVVVVDSLGKIVMMNPASHRILGFDSSEVAGKDYFDHFCPPDQVEWRREKFLEVMRSERQITPIVEREIIRKDGEHRIIRWHSAVVRDGNGLPENILMAGEDVTEQRSMEDALREATERAKQATAAKSEFLANMSHEIRTPLNAITGLSYLLELTQLDAKQIDYAGKISASAEILRHVVNNVLDFSKIESGKVELDLQPFNIYELYARVSGVFGHQLTEKKIDLRFSMGIGISGGLLGDPLRIMQVLTNLVSNAIKFTERGSITIGCDLLRDGAKRLLEFSVTDTGMGMATNQLERVFGTFTQADASITRKYGGTGLGLAISKGLVEAMGGKIRVSSVAGEGTTFRFSVVLDSSEKEGVSDLRALVVGGSDAEKNALSENLRTLAFEPVYAGSAMDAVLKLDPSSSSGALGFSSIFVFEQESLEDGERLAAALRAMLERAGKNSRIILLRDAPAPSWGLDPAVADQVLPRSNARAEVFNQLLMGVAASAEPHEAGKSSTALLGLTVLVVEDNEINQMVAEEILTLAGANVQIASNGAEAIERVRKNPRLFDAVLMDLQMPDMDGYQTAIRLRESHSAERLPIIALTAQALTSESRKSAEAGMNDFVTKPIEPAVLIHSIATVCSENLRKPNSLVRERKTEVPQN